MYVFTFFEKKKMGFTGALTKWGRQVLQKYGGIKDDLYPGEHHGIMKLPNGRYERGAYIGPGTQVIKRYRAGIKGKTPVDQVAKQHDT